ncbi:hypothetical protein RISK_004658 [Rhodopirellula islandica]|uniref:Uncharacterized protein n=1 Tax=Rhodopirellula islandica TaxID=595434 RepID=A0A0J1BA23_RHOIS|nr:hypothetical protein RISK_004658 [Rhodopirellula islandica]
MRRFAWIDACVSILILIAQQKRHDHRVDAWRFRFSVSRKTGFSLRFVPSVWEG